MKETKYPKIFAALDGQETQRVVAEKAYLAASANGAELRFGHVIDTIPAEASAINYTQVCDEMKQKLEKDLSDVFEKAKNDPNIPDVSLVVVAGTVTETMDHALIEPYDPDLVICGARGLSNLRYAFVGSVSTHLIRTQKCDVLVVKDPTLEKKALDEKDD